MESKDLVELMKENPVEASMRLLKELMSEETPMATDDDLKQMLAVQAAFLHSLGVGLLATSTKGMKLDRGKIRMAFKAMELSRMAGESAIKTGKFQKRPF